MAISYLYTGEPMTGTANDDFVIAYKGSTGTDNNTVNGNGGDDLVIGDSSDTWIPNASYLNGSIAAAFNLETLTSTWTTAENEMFGNWTIPHTTAIVETTIGQSEYFRVAIGAGQQITIDLDFASNTPIGNPLDLVVELQDSLGNVIVTADDSLVTDGGQGSFPSTPGSASSYDPFLSYTIATGGIYYINVRPFGGGPGSTFTDNNTFVMNLTVTGHAVAATNPVQGADTINGGEGHDALFGQGGADIINGDGGDDFIDSGSGGDIVHGGEGNDTIYGGDGTEENINGDNGNDTLISGGEGHYYGDAGDDIIFAGLTAGVNEVLDGGADIDTIDTTTWNGAYTINLATGTTDFGEIFTNFENVKSGNGTDTITGTSGANVITTQGGADTVNAGAGNDIVAGGADGDTLNGGADFDILDYRMSSGAVTINLATNAASGGHATGDTISNFEGVYGSVLGDTLTGTRFANVMMGAGGNDTLNGGDGFDTAVFAGARGSYSWNTVGQTTQITSGAEGTDTLSDFERMQFSDSTYEFSNTGYAAPAAVFGGFGAGAAAGGWSSNDAFPRTLADVNGDTRPDLVGFGDGGVYVALGNGSGGFGSATLGTVGFGSGAAAGGWSNNTTYPRTLADVNGDGRADVVGFGDGGVYVALANGSGGFGPAFLGTVGFGAGAAAGGWSSNTTYPRTLADVNGDGKADVVGFGDGGVYVALATGGGLFGSAFLASPAFGAGAGAGGWASNEQFPRTVVDINSDGRADVVGFGSAGTYISFGREDGTFVDPFLAFAGFGADPAAGGWSSDELFPRTVGDIDGDSRADLVGFGDAGVHVAYGDGAGGFTAGGVVLNWFGTSAGAGGWTNDTLYPRMLADLNSDGAVDIVGFGDGGVQAALSVSDWLLV